MKINLKLKFSNIYTIIIVLLPLVDLFPSKLFSSFTLSMSLLVILSLVGIAKCILSKKSISLKKTDIFLVVFLIYISLTNIISNTLFPTVSETTGYFSTFSTVYFILVFVCVLNYHFWEDELARNILIVVGVFASVLVILQSVVYYGRGTYLKVIPIEYMTESIQKQYFRLFTNSMEGGLFRPCAFFLEPSYYCEYVVFGLACCLVNAKNSKKNHWYYLSGIFSLGMFLTTSGLGIFCVIALWGVYLLSLLKENNKLSRANFAFFSIGLIVVIVFIANSDILGSAVNRFFSIQEGFHHVGRVQGYSYFDNLTFWEKITGIGYGREPEKVYFTNWICFLIRIGYIGIVTYFATLLSWRKNWDLLSKLFVVAYIVIFITAGTYSFFNFVFFLSLIQSSKFRKKLESLI